jgi:hypothetical protein
MAKFKARARAIDMLGRQQIAGIPTAISELFKNAHDAYADAVEVDYFRADDLLVLRDDGIGMTYDDFVERWLAIGTESKLGVGLGLDLPPKPAGKESRPMLGEKGIGRLAIAAIGPQVLIITRAKRGSILNETVAAFINWAIFESPGLDLDQIDIPVKKFDQGLLPGREDVLAMVEAFKKNLVKLHSLIEPSLSRRIEAELKRFSVDPQKVDTYVRQLSNLSLGTKGHGTHFFIVPTSESLVADIEGDSVPDSAPPLIKTLIGFSNTMRSDSAHPRIMTSFRDHKKPEVFDDLISANEFFTPDEFATADHHFLGRFDEYGQFEGTVTIYREKPVKHAIAWADAKGVPTECGAFNLSLAYVQGDPKESSLSPDDYAQLIRKLNQIGGLYIYKDGIRVLPYGNSDYDFLDIEKRRTLSAGFYYFSYRRMFGYIEISGIKNAELSEKAGREGFRENKAYRQFRAILKNFFLQTAADFFRESGAYSDAYFESKEELKRLADVRRERELQVKKERAAFGRNLNRFFSQLHAGTQRSEAEGLLGRIKKKLDRLSSIEESERPGALLDIESEAHSIIDQLRARSTVVRPRGIGLTTQLRRDWEIYNAEVHRLEIEVFAPTIQQCDELISTMAEQLRSTVASKKMAGRILKDKISEARTHLGNEKQHTTDVLSELDEKVSEVIHTCVLTFDNAVLSILDEFERLRASYKSESMLIKERNRLISSIQEVTEGQVSVFENIRVQLRGISVSTNGGTGASSADIIEALEEENLSLREKSEAEVELAQLGMAISVISHEFESAVKAIRGELRRLKSWADRNAAIRDLYKSLRSNFDHLDGYLTLFTPLQRRLYRTKVEIRGADIAKYLKNLFADRLLKVDADIQPTNRFAQITLTGYPSTFYPVFINLVDNSLFWLKDRTGPRIIRLDAENGSLIVADTGPGITLRDREAVFERGFTRKPGGRGMGLKISRDVLAKEGYSLILGHSEPGEGAVFKIEPLQNQRKGR